MMMRFVTWTIAVLGIAGLVFVTGFSSMPPDNTDPPVGGPGGTQSNTSTPPHHSDEPIG